MIHDVSVLNRRSCLSGLLAFWLAIGFPIRVGAAGTNRVILVTIDGLAAYYLHDPQAPLPTLRRMAAEGAAAEGLRVSNPTTTWANHTTLITGVRPDKHSVLFNGVLVRGGPGEPVRIEGDRDQSELVAVPTLYDRLHGAGWRTAAINWPATRGASTLDDNFPDTPDRVRAMTPRLRAELIRAGVLADATDPSFLKKGAAAADQAWAAAALHLLKARPPKLLLLHLLNTDVVQHQHGPRSAEAHAALGQADAQLAELLRALDQTEFRQSTILMVVSDHGFAKPSRLIRPNVILRKAGLLRPRPRRRAQAVSEGGTACVYLTNPETAKSDRATVRELLRRLEGISRILEPAQYAGIHLPDPGRNQQMGDLLLVAKDDYAFSDEFFDEEAVVPLPIPVGSHGYLATDPRMNGVFIAWGHQIRPGTKLGMVDNVDVAPTIAVLLGTSMPDTDGKVLGELLMNN